MTKKGILKANNAFERLKGASIVAFLTSLGTVAIAGFVFFGVGVSYSDDNDAVNKYKRTQEYRIEITEEVNDVYNQFENGEMTWEQAGSKIDYLQGDEYAEKKLMQSSNQELKNQKIKQDKTINTVAYTIFGTVGAVGLSLASVGLAYGGAAATDRAYDKKVESEKAAERKKKEEEEAETEGIEA